LASPRRKALDKRGESMFQRYAVPAAMFALVAMSSCSSGSQSALAPSGVHQPVSSGTARHTMSTSGSAGGSFKLVGHAKIVGGQCQPTNSEWSTPVGGFSIPLGHQAFAALSTMVLPNANDVTFTNSTLSDFGGDLVVSSSSTSYSPVGTWSGLVWTPPSAGTYYAGYRQYWDNGGNDCGGTVYGPETASFTWSQP
jgi:hypothetical protein